MSALCLRVQRCQTAESSDPSRLPMYQRIKCDHPRSSVSARAGFLQDKKVAMFCCYSASAVSDLSSDIALARAEIYRLRTTYAKLVGKQMRLEPTFPALGDIDLPKATAMIASLKEKIETITAELAEQERPMSPEDRATIIALRAEYDALQPSVVPFVSFDHMNTGSARTHIANLRQWIGDLKAGATRTSALVLRTPMSPEDRAEIIRLRAEYEALDPYPCVRPYGPIGDMDLHSAISHIATLRLWISARKTMKERMDMTRGGHGGSMSSWVGSDGHTLPGFPGPPREYTDAKLAMTRPVL
jgi:hypothetical protein